MTHNVHYGHPDTIYFDDCEECTRKAKDPVFHLDRPRAELLWRKMIDVEIFENGSYNSENEAIAAKQLYRIYLFLERFTTQNPQILNFMA